MATSVHSGDHPDDPPAPAPQPLAASIAGALAWWRDAGVDCAFEDAPRNWLSPPPIAGGAATGEPPPAPNGSMARAPAPPEPAAKIAPPEPASMIGRPQPGDSGGQAANWPATLPAFQAWWLGDPSLDIPELTGFSGPRVPPRGPANPPLMVIVPQPEEGDSDQLLAGNQGRLLGAILPMLGLAEAEVYIASALPRAMALPDWPALAARGLGAVLMHHVALVAPARVIAFGANALPLLSHAPTQSTATFPQLDHEGFSCPLLPAGDLAMLLERPAAKARFWQNWLEFSGS